MSDWEIVEDSDWEVVQNQPKQQSMKPPENVRGWRGVGKDVAEGVTGIPAAAWNMLKGAFVNAPSEIMGLGEQAMREPTRPLRELATGALDLPVAIGNIPAYTEKYFRSKFGDPSKQTLSIMENPFESLLGTKEQKPGSAMMRLAGSLVSAGPLSEAGPATGMARMGQRAGVAGGMAAGEGQNPITAGGLVPGVELPFRGVGKMSGGLPGRATPQEALKRSAAVEGTNVPIYEIVDSPILKMLNETVADKLIFSGADSRSAKLANQVLEKADNLINREALPQDLYTLNESFKDSLIKTFENAKNIKNELYNPVSELMEVQGINLELPKTRTYAKEISSLIEESPLYSSDKDFRSLLNRLAGFKNPEIVVKGKILNQQGTPYTQKTIYPTMAESLTTADKLSSYANDLKKSTVGDDKFRASKFEQLAEKIREDVRDSVNGSRNQELIDAYNAATENYIENYAPFKDKDISKELDINKNSDDIARTIVKPGKGDKYQRIKKFQRLMPENEKNLLGQAYLSEAFDVDGTINPKKLATAINNLGPKQIEALFPDLATRQSLLDYRQLLKMGGKSLDEMLNPKTGFSAGKGASYAGQILWGLGEPFSFAGANVLSQAFGRAMQNPKFKKWYLDNYLNPGKITDSATKYPSKAALVQPEEK